MADSKYSLLPPAALLTGAEIFAVDQAGNSVRTTVSAVGNNALGIYTAPGIGAVAQTVAAKLAQTVSVLDFGADPTGAASSSAAILAAITAMGLVNGVVLFPPGIYKCSTAITYTLPSATSSLGLAGGGVDGSQVNFTTSGGNGITINFIGQFNYVHIRDLAFTTTNTTSSGAGLILNQTAASIPNPANSAQSDITNCVFRGADGYAASQYWGIGVSVISASNVNVTNCTFVSNSASAGIGVKLLATAAVPGGVFNFSGCTFNYTSQGIVVGSYAQGVAVNECNFTGGAFGIICPAGTVGTDQLLVSDSQFECSSVGIFAQAALPNIGVSDNLFIVGLLPTASGINLGVSSIFSITGNVFNPVSGPASTTGIAIAGTIATLGGVITGNTIYSMASGLLLTGTASNVNVQANNFVACTTAISNSGTNNVIANNSGYNPVGTGAGIVGASPATITNGASPATYYFSQAATFTASVKIGGVVVGIMGNGATTAIDLGPNESCVVTWTTTAPTYVQSIH